MISLLRITLISLPLILFTSCRSTPSNSFYGQQCSPSLTYVDIAGKLYVDPDQSACFCRDYKMTLEYVGPIGGDVTMPLNHCNKIIGYSPKVYSEQATFLDWVRTQINSDQD